MSFDRLTQRARMRFSELRDSAETAQSVIRNLQANIGANEKAARNLAGDNKDNAKAQRPFLDEIARLRTKMEPLQENYRALAGLLTRVEMFVGTIPAGGGVSDAKAVSYKVQDGEPDIERVQHVRIQIEELGARRRKAAHSFLSISELRVAVSEYVSRLAEEGKPSITLDGNRVEIKSHAGTPAICLMAWSDPEPLKASLNMDIDRLVVDLRKRGFVEMSAKARKAVIEKLDAEILALECEEQFFVRSAIESGQHVTQREKADPRAVLGVMLLRRDVWVAEAAE